MLLNHDWKKDVIKDINVGKIVKFTARVRKGDRVCMSGDCFYQASLPSNCTRWLLVPDCTV